MSFRAQAKKIQNISMKFIHTSKNLYIFPSFIILQKSVKILKSTNSSNKQQEMKTVTSLILSFNEFGFAETVTSNQSASTERK